MKLSSFSTILLSFVFISCTKNIETYDPLEMTGEGRVEYTFFNSLDRLSTRRIYDERDSLLEYCLYQDGGKECKYRTIEFYSESGLRDSFLTWRKIKSKWRLLPAKIKLGNGRFYHDTNGNILKLVSCEDGNVYQESFSYDSLGRLSDCLYKYSDSLSSYEKTHYTYGDDGRVSEKTKTRGNDESEISNYYYSDSLDLIVTGFDTTKTYHTKEGTVRKHIEWNYVYTYDEKGSLSAVYKIIRNMYVDDTIKVTQYKTDTFGVLRKNHKYNLYDDNTEITERYEVRLDDKENIKKCEERLKRGFRY